MKLSKSLVFASLLAVALGGCTQSRKPGRGSKTSRGGVPELELTEEQRAIYEEHYCNKTDCFGNPVSQYNILNQAGYSLIKEIHKYLIDQHHTYIKYSSINGSIFKNIDKVPNTSGQIELFYTGKRITSYSSSQNREHVWPCADSPAGLWWRSSSSWEYKIDTNGNYWGGGSDLYHIRPADKIVNAQRSNSKFYDFKEGDPLPQYTVSESGGYYSITVDDISSNPSSNPSSAKRVEVDDAFKGDVARLLMYMYVHYMSTGYDVYYSNDDRNPTNVYTKEEANTPHTETIGGETVTHTPYVCGNMTLRDIINYKTEEECYALIKEWNAIDAPSEVEKARCDTIESQYQGNRNPFVDFPQLIDRCF